MDSKPIERKKKQSKLYTKYFIVISSIVFICITVAGSLMVFLLYQTTRQEKQTSILNSVIEISSATTQQLEHLALAFKIKAEAYMDEHNIENESDLTSEDKAAITDSLVNSMREVTESVCGLINIHANVMNADFFICDTLGRVVFCKELLENPDLSNCPIHSNITVDSDTRLKATDAKKRSYVGNLNGTYTERHFISGYSIMINSNDSFYVFGTQAISIGLHTFRTQVLRILFFSCFLALLLSLITVYFLAYSMTKPIKEISAAIKRYSKGDFSYRIPVRGNDEMSELISSFNSMANSLALIESSRRSFIANVSHELKTPMTTIGGFVDGILDGTITSKKQQNHYLSIVSDEVKRLSRLITSMLNMSKIEAGELKLLRKRYNISDQIINCLLSFEKIISDKNIQINGLDTMGNIQVFADEDMISQVIYNLLDNAVKFTPVNGIISFDAFSNAGEVVVKIKNTGVGIAVDDLRKVFERFYKVDKSRSLDTKSVGLGLYIVKSILELHDGFISVASDENDFVEFTFRLPLKG